MLHLNGETVGWFFVHDLQLDWRLAEWFESRLLDYDCVLNWGIPVKVWPLLSVDINDTPYGQLFRECI